MGRRIGRGRRDGVSRENEEIKSIDWKRQSLIFNPSDFELATVTIVGLGNIGSQTALALARLGINMLWLFDHDRVESHNLSSQSFDTSHLDMFKVLASRDQIKKINPAMSVAAQPVKFLGHREDVLGNDVIIIAVDSMKERKAICAQMKKSKMTFPKLLIDGRMGGPQLEVYSVHSYKEWEDTFCDNPSTDPCGARYICYTSMVIGAFIANQVKRFLKGEKLKSELLFNIDTYQLYTDK